VLQLTQHWVFDFSKEIEISMSKRYLHLLVYPTLFTTAKVWNQTGYPLIDEWIKKM
jgi:hypothetical protein